MQLISRSRVLALALLVGLVAAPLATAELDSREFKQAKKDLLAALERKDTDGMVTAIKKIASDGTERAVDLLISLGAGLEDYKVYEAVRDSLQNMKEREAIDYMVEALEKKKSAKQWSLRCVLLEGLIPHGGEAITKAMAEQLDDRVPYVISAAAKALGKRKDPAAIPYLIDALRELEENKDVPWIDTKQALTDITGEDLADAVQWADWWKANPDFDPSKDRGDKTEATVSRGGVQFFKEQIVSKRIMFVIDVSGSMEAEDPPIDGQGGGKRIERVKQELIRTVNALKGDVHFNILAFSDTLRSWKRIERGGLERASRGNKKDATKWVEGLQANGMTHTDEALEKAFELLEVNTIVLLSDGAPMKVNKQTNQQEDIDPSEILAKVKGWNRLRGVKIHTFCFEVFTQMAGAEPLLDFMGNLAKQNGGKMTLIR